MERLPAHLEVSALLRAVESAGGFATVLARGERDAGSIAILTITRGKHARLWERMPQLDGSRPFEATRYEEPGKTQEFSEYLSRRRVRDPDLWLIELDIADPERFIAELPR